MHPDTDLALKLLIPPDVPSAAQMTQGRELQHSGEVFGTQWSLRVLRNGRTNPDNDAVYLANIIKACGQVLELIDAQMSLWREGSHIVRYNRRTHGERLTLPEPFATVASKAFSISQQTHGAFYPGLYEAVEQWGFGAASVADPVASGLAYAQLHERNDLRLPEMHGAEIAKRDGFMLDLNGIAKGYAVDLLCDVVRSHPDTVSCLIEIGGELKGFGTRADGMPFWTDVAPDGDAGKASYRAALYGWACATSGEAERFHVGEGEIFSHIIDPQTRASVRTDLIAVTVFDKECARADALATALMVMGADKALAFANANAIACILTRRDEPSDVLSDAMLKWIDDD
ncbi:MAG: FAD:protein FMN transferase [Pseudomonadota bacterium]